VLLDVPNFSECPHCGFNQVRLAELKQPECDFCSSREPVKDYRVRAFEHAQYERPDGSALVIGSDEDWSACAGCAELIDKNDREALARRTWEALPFSTELEETQDARGIAFVKDGIRTLHDQFFACRIPEEGASTC
jgi:hypothetical protein